MAWQYLFPSVRLSLDPEVSRLRRHHMDESTVNKVIKKATLKAGIRTVRAQLGHQDVKTTEIYTHVLKRGARGVRNPLSDLNNG